MCLRSGRGLCPLSFPTLKQMDVQRVIQEFMLLTSAIQKLQSEVTELRRDVYSVQSYINNWCEARGETCPFELYDEPIGAMAALWGEDY